MDFNAIDEYVKRFADRFDLTNAGEAMGSFSRDWKEIVDRNAPGVTQGLIDGEELYGKALVVYSAAMAIAKISSAADVQELAGLIEEYVREVKFMFAIKADLFNNLAHCWYGLGERFDDETVAAFKKSVSNELSASFHSAYAPVAFSFHGCGKYTLDALREEKINVTSPVRFNDPFDCPVREIVSGWDGGRLSSLVRRAYEESLKIACFVSNRRLPHLVEHPDGGRFPESEEKIPGAAPEYLNPLMWAHYADSHRGICIKYSFPHAMTVLGSSRPDRISFFRDVEYSDAAFDEIGADGNGLRIDRAFFLKGLPWKYENELRFLVYDPSDQDYYGTIPAPGCVEAVYFGVNCSESDKQNVKDALSDKKFRRFQGGGLDGTPPVEEDILFYQMTFDREHFGSLVALPVLS